MPAFQKDTLLLSIIKCGFANADVNFYKVDNGIYNFSHLDRDKSLQIYGSLTCYQVAFEADGHFEGVGNLTTKNLEISENN